MKFFFSKIAFATLVAATFFSCTKNENGLGKASQIEKGNASFFKVNGVPMQTYTINILNGGSFTSPQGSVVQIPANAFTLSNGAPVGGLATIEFKDIYKKSDMLLSDVCTRTQGGALLKSAGEFFIKASQAGQTLVLAPAKKITVTQPAKNLPVDTAMQTFTGGMNPVTGAGFAWTASSADSLTFTAGAYVYNLCQLNSSAWLNSDNSTFFSAYPQTSLTLHNNDTAIYKYIDAFLVFDSVNTVLHLYPGNPTPHDHTYTFAPTGLSCTAVALCTVNGKLYSSFTHFTINTNQNLNFNFSETTTAEFKTALMALD